MPTRTEPTDFAAGMVVRSPEIRNNNPLYISVATPTYVLFDGYYSALNNLTSSPLINC
jgi:hypothetical protein